MRQPVEREVPEVVAGQVGQHERLPAPAVSLSPGRKLREPDAQFVKDIATCIRAGTRPLTAALWLGCTRRQWRAWKQRRGEPYDQLRAAVRAATAHIEMRLQADLAKKSPGAALKGLRRVRDEEHEPELRRYDKSGVNTLKRLMPDLLQRIGDDGVADSDLSPVEQTAREWRESVIADLGGRDALITTKLSLINACLGSWLLLSSVDAYLMQLAGTTGVVDKKYRRLYPVAEQRMSIAATLTKQLQALGLERPAPKTLSLTEAIAEAKAARLKNGRQE